MQLLPWDKSFTEYQIHQNSNKKVENLVHNVLFNLIDIIFRIISFGFSGFANPKPVKQEVSCTVILPPMMSVLCNCICSICFKCWYSLSSHFVVRLWRRLIGFNTKMASKMNRLWNRAEIMIDFLDLLILPNGVSRPTRAAADLQNIFADKVVSSLRQILYWRVVGVQLNSTWPSKFHIFRKF